MLHHSNNYACHPHLSLAPHPKNVHCLINYLTCLSKVSCVFFFIKFTFKHISNKNSKCLLFCCFSEVIFVYIDFPQNPFFCWVKSSITHKPLKFMWWSGFLVLYHKKYCLVYYYFISFYFSNVFYIFIFMFYFMNIHVLSIAYCHPPTLPLYPLWQSISSSLFPIYLN